ncbi:MAG: hypothetical protein ACC641_05945 [Acidiferrobacterales bacterium]
MSRLSRITILVLMAFFALSLGACSGKTRVKSDLNLKGAPNWVNKGTQILKDKRGRLFHGVGIAGPIGDISLQRDAADNRARAELARVLSSYMDVVSSDYVAASGGGKEQTISRQINNLSKINLTGAKIIGRWRDKRTNTIYSIVELDMKRMKKTLAQVQGMNADLKRYIDQNGDNIFDNMTAGSR